MKTAFNKGIIVLLAGLGVNLMLGTLYAWGVISAALMNLGWSATATQIPYMLACAMFAFSMVPGGKLQDKFGPRKVIMGSAILAGIGLNLSGLLLTPVSLTITFGLIFGIAMGTGYSAPTPAAVKWFHPSKRGVISGAVVSGFGLAPVYVGPLTTYLIGNYGIETTFFVLGSSFFVGIMALAQLIKNPPEGYLPPAPEESETIKVKPSFSTTATKEFQSGEMLKTKQFKMIWSMFACGTFAGLLIIGQLSNIGLEQSGITNGFMLASIYAVFNAFGRLQWGIISDKIGRTKSLLSMFLLQVVAYIILPFAATPALLILSVAMVGFTFGGMLTVFPAITGDYFGMKNFGVNYGFVITAWGIGGVFGPLVGGLIRDYTGGYAYSYVISGLLSIVGMYLALKVTAPTPEKTMEPATTEASV
ncbi:L-lactate MFS transporter [Isachenkonia alkalipeptolytica]|uniref:OFA family MFS transporter n=1 Tax=Isachenkonia alkalipeptolytica TaxID=2565777 RepID=A0AA43XKW5_9CLOT|nr:OFA family MFS transporter [Isachenkonia alkalipeptolytica]NBG87740.1 OFA family MFS transporter [Isachenkonia alkalipeptolytica]